MFTDLVMLLLNVLLGHGSTSHALTHRATLFVLAAPPLVLLSLGWRRSWLEHAAGWFLVCYLFDRLLEDFATFSPLAVLAAAGWIMVSVFRSEHRFKRRREVLVFTALGGAGLAAGLVRLPTDGLTCAVVSSGLVLAFCLHTFDRNKPAVNVPATVLIGIAGAAVGTLMLQGLTSTFLILLSSAIVGWLTVGFCCWRMRRTGVMRPVGVLATVIAAVLLTILPAEIYFRYVYDTSDINNMLSTHKRWETRHATLNRWNYRDEEFEPLNRYDDHLRVILLGDSFAWAQGINDPADTPAGQLQTALSNRVGTSRPVKVFNLAIGGATTQGERNAIRRDGPRIKPHVVVWQYLTNDADDMLDLRLRHRGHPALEPWRPLTDASCSLEFLSWRLYELVGLRGADRLADSIGVYADDEKFAQHVKDIDALLGEIRAFKAKPVVWLFPLLDRPADRGPQGLALDRLETCFAERNIPTLSVREHVQTGGPEHWVNRFDPHPNPALHRAVVPKLAELVLETLVEDDGDSGR